MSAEPSLAFQTALRARLVASRDVTRLVPATAIRDAARPEVVPCILLGVAHVNPADRYEQFYDEVFADVHVWSTEGLSAVKAISHVIRGVIEQGAWIVEDHRVINARLASVRFLRDPDGVHSRAVLSIEATLQQTVTA